MPKIELEIPDYNKYIGLQYSWEDGYNISTDLQDNAVVISANKAGLISLAKQMLTLANAPYDGAHFHYDDYGCLEEGSLEIIICRMKEEQGR